MPSMKAVQVSKPGGDLELVEREIPKPGPGQVRIRVQACGVCHSDSVTKDGLFPGISYPRVPGHEIASMIEKVPLARAAEGYARMMSGKAEFRVVLTM